MKSYKLSNKHDAKRLIKDIENAAMSDIPFECPSCGAEIILNAGANKCPECGQEINLDFE